MNETGFSPPMPLEWAWLLALGIPVAGGFLAWRSNRAASSPAMRSGLTGLRVLGLVGAGMLFLNPGLFEEPEKSEPRVWAVMLDRSGSMNTPDAGGRTRWEAGRDLTRSLVQEGGDRVRQVTFASGLIDDEAELPDRANGDGTAIVKSGTALFSGAAGLGSRLGGLVLVSDGRETQAVPELELISRAQADGVPIHVVPLGTNWGSKDLRLRAARRLVTTFPDKPVVFRVIVTADGLGRIRPRVRVTDAGGREYASREVALEPGEPTPVTIEVPKLSDGTYRLSVEPWQGEDVTTNNADEVRVQVIEGRTRVFLAEGEPYWDSKFLAQLFRAQDFMKIRAVYRLNEERYFMVDSEGSEPAQTDADVFPATAEALAEIDVVVLGKGMEGFLTREHIAALKRFVRDQGGALLLSRGRPSTSTMEGFEALEPVEWGGKLDGEFRFQPETEGSGAGLFGQMLPAADDPVWIGLPPLKDADRIARLKPFTQVLAYGTQPAGQREERVPMLVARRYGRGVVAMVNADGLWKWDFFPKARELGNMYEEFWTQWLQWAASYAEFLPGQDLSLRLSETSVPVGRPVRATIGWRGGGAEPAPLVEWHRGGEVAGSASASKTVTSSDEDGGQWTAMIQPKEPGSYRLRVVDTAQPGKLGPEAMLRIEAPPTENEILDADPGFLRRLAEATGGRIWKPEQREELAELLKTDDTVQSIGAPQPVWHPLWPQAWVLCGITGLLGSEWWLRRRGGLQ